jgi:hypothetical protein
MGSFLGQKRKRIHSFYHLATLNILGCSNLRLGISSWVSTIARRPKNECALWYVTVASDSARVCRIHLLGRRAVWDMRRLHCLLWDITPISTGTTQFILYNIVTRTSNANSANTNNYVASLIEMKTSRAVSYVSMGKYPTSRRLFLMMEGRYVVKASNLIQPPNSLMLIR